jgi:hypothetical protein
MEPRYLIEPLTIATIERLLRVLSRRWIDIYGIRPVSNP